MCQFKVGTNVTIIPFNGKVSGKTRIYYPDPPASFNKNANTGCPACGFVPKDVKIRCGVPRQLV